MRTVSLGGRKAAGRVAIVDDEDFDLVGRYSWHILETVLPNGRVDGPYARTKLPGSRATVLLHALITGYRLTDHANGDGLDCRRINLRLATKGQNRANSRPQPGASSRYKGVDRQQGKWRSRIRINGRLIYLGCFTSEEDAAIAYDLAAREAFGEFAYVNFPH